MLRWSVGFALATLLAGPAASVPRLSARPGGVATDSLPAWAQYLSGRWGCTGAFASGRPLAADVTFAADLGGRWLQYRHTDRAPGQFQAFALWGPLPGASHHLAAVLHDNAGGQRRFQSAGWREDAIVWGRDSTDPGARSERFTYRRTSDSTFWFAWEVRRAPAADWSVGDSLTCRRASVVARPATP